MPRKLRVEFAGAIYHVMNRGDRREAIFRDDRDRRRFMDTLAETVAKTDWQVHAFCLMPNHFHLVVETPQPNLVAGMKWFLGTYTIRFNRRHRIVGHLFSGRYKSLVVSGRGGYLRTVAEYVHLNPVRAKLIPTKAPLRDYPWSSFPAYLKSTSQRPTWMRVDRVLGECGIHHDSPAGRRRFERLQEERRARADGEDFVAVRRNWCLGDDAFREDLLERVSEQAGPEHYGPELAEAAEAQAGRIVAEELARHGSSPEDLATRRKGDPVKVAIAVRLRRETTVTLRWIANRLEMGTRSHLVHLLYWDRRRERKKVCNTID